MKWIRRYDLWKKARVNEEIGSKALKIAKLHDKQFPDRAAKIRKHVAESYDSEFTFFFFPTKAEGASKSSPCKVEFRAYVGSREDAKKIAEISQAFFDLPSLPTVNKLWREIGDQKADEGMVTVDPSMATFKFDASKGCFALLDHRGDEQPSQPILLKYDRFKTTSNPMAMNPEYRLDFRSHFRECGERQQIMVLFDKEQGALTASIEIGPIDWWNERLYAAAGFKEPKATEEEEIPEEDVKKWKEAIDMSENRPQAAKDEFARLMGEGNAEYLPNIKELLDGEWTFILRRIDADRDCFASFAKVRQELKLATSEDIDRFKRAYLKSDKEAEDASKLIRMFAQIAEPNRAPLEIDHRKLVAEPVNGDVEVKAKLVIRRNQGSYSFGEDCMMQFRWEFKGGDYFGKESRFLDLDIDDSFIAYLSSNDDFYKDKLFAKVSMY